eukprot:2397556-Prymnesium_polylepis.1
MSDYGCATKLIPLQFDTYEAHTANRTIDFIFPNPTAFQEMKSKYGVHEFLSVKRNFGADQELDRFGGVIVRAATHLKDVLELADLQTHPGLRVCAVNPNAFGGWHIQWYEMLKNAVDVTGTLDVAFLGGHEKAIRAAVVDRTCDIGIARTETIERMIRLGEFNETDIFTIGEKGPLLSFPQHLSTELYPEWPLASLSHVPREIEQLVAIPLLTLSRDSPEAIQGDFAGFAFPYSYEPVRQMFLAIDKAGTGQCDPGLYREGENPGVCVDCPAGTYSEEGIGECALCPIGTVNNGTRNTDCSFCPDGLTTVVVGSVFGDCSTAAETDRTHVDFVIIIIAFGGVLTVLLVTLCAFGTRRLVRHYKMLRQTEIAAQQQKLRRLKDAVNVMQKLRFPFTVMRFSTFKMRGKLVNHESARNDGSLLMLDTWSEAVAFAKSNPVVFHSHQWLGFRMPDPWNIHYSSMVRVGELLCREHGHTEDELFFWVDFHSIPQACLDSKLGAIASIAVYACCARYFAVVAPDAVHADLKETCNAASYARRG